MPVSRIDRQRPQFEPIVLPSRPIIPLEAASVAAAPLNGVSPSVGSKSVEVRVLKSSLRFSADEVVRNLFLGSSCDAACLEELERRNIRNILNVATECEFGEEILQAEARGAMKTKKVHLVDHSDHDIAKNFPDCNEFILSALQRGEGVLVHCRMGVSRSAAVVISFLMHYGGVYFPAKQRSFESKRKDTHMEPTTQPHRHSACDTTMTTQGALTSSTTAQSRAVAPDEEQLAVASATQTYPISYSDAFDYVKSRRREVAPNLGFCLALRDIDVVRGVLEDIWDFSDAAAM